MFQDADKAALAFILNPSAASSCAAPATGGSPTLSPSRKSHHSDAEDAAMDTASEDTASEDDAERKHALFHIQGRSLLASGSLMETRVNQLLSLANHHGKMRVRKAAVCAHADCPRAAVSRGRCVRHGGGSRCTFPDCTHGARLYNRCFHHGGCKLCKVDGCTSKAKRYGYCWSHGGGHICDAAGCTKVAAPGGFCWAHGGGNRCKVDSCNRRSYQKHGYYCKQHTAATGGGV
ncbi:hypothetical protein PybrP1_011083 [[Pythium] brassicae (nom. inval.)]|nr:hypothetical protein PybrP1_011083 [[Pythium] brassicae (nom. inval.)]